MAYDEMEGLDLEQDDAPERKEYVSERVKTAVQQAVTDAIKFIDDEVGPEREKNTKYYKTESVPELIVNEGRSSVVMSEVRDNVLGTIPSFLRIVFGPDRVVEFAPKNAQTVEQAQQQTDYVNHVFLKDNNGFMLTHSVVQDALVRRLGIYKWGWDGGTPERHSLMNLTQEQVDALALDPTVKIVELGEAPAGEDGTPRFDAKVDVANDGSCWVDSVPPEEFLYSREARGLDKGKFLFIGHRREMTTAELIALGIDEETIEQHGGVSSSLQDNVERRERQSSNVTTDRDPEAGKENEKHEFIEGYMMLSLDDEEGEGTARLYRIDMLGAAHEIISEPVPVDDVPFAVYCPYPEAHSMSGDAQADLTRDMQRVKTNLVRNTLDSLSLSLFPRTAHQDGMVNVADLANNEIGADIRTYGPPEQVMKSFSHNFVGREVLPFISMMDETTERRTGRSAGAAGLDMDALQSTGKEAAEAAVQGSQEHLDLLVRLFAETTLKRMFRGIRDMLIKYKPQARMVRLSGKWVEVNPAVWDADLAVDVNVALGGAHTQKKLAILQETAAKMEQVFATLGPDNPLVTMVEYRNVLAEATRLMGRPDVETFWRPVTPEMLEQIAQQKAMQPPPPTPEQIIAQAQMEIERMKTERELAIQQDKLELERQKVELEDDRERDRLSAELALKKYELELKYGSDAETARMREEMEAMRASMNASTADADVVVRAQVENEKRETELQREEMRLTFEREKLDREEALRRAELESKERIAAVSAQYKAEQQREQPSTPRKLRAKITYGEDGRPNGVEEA